MGSVLESRESSKNEDGKTDIIYKTMYANGAVALRCGSFVFLSNTKRRASKSPAFVV